MALQEYLPLQGSVGDDGVMSESMKYLGDLLETERSRRKESVDVFAAALGCSSRSYAYWKDGEKAPERRRRREVEDALGWREGSITEVLDGKWVWGSLESVRIPDPSTVPVKRAADLTDDELLVEVAWRFRNYANKANETTLTPLPERWQNEHDLAARKEKLVRRPPKN